MSAPKTTRKATCVRRVEYERGWGWIARRRDGAEVVPGFRWNSRSVARSVAYERDLMEAARGKQS